MDNADKDNLSSNQGFTEADFEAEISHVIRHVFPAISSGEIKRQKRFKIELGKNSYDVNNCSRTWAAGRADILLMKDEKPLAVLELKRKGLILTGEDSTQGLSYARAMNPWPPLVIVSNGEETRIFKTFTGELWEGESFDEKSLVKLFRLSANLAETDLRNAVITLLGPGPDIWMSFVKRLTQETIDGLTGEWDDLLSPFPRELLLKRKVTAKIIDLIKVGSRIPLVVGSPLAGKSNVLRDLVTQAKDEASFVVLYIDMGSTRQGVFQVLADALSNELGWPIDNKQVRTWLRLLSQSKEGPKLVLALDVSDADEVGADLDTFISETFGRNLKLVVAADSGLVDRLVLNKTRHYYSRFGKQAIGLVVEPLDDEEFHDAREVLYEKNIRFSHGGHRALEFRVPWMLRSIVADMSKWGKHLDKNSQSIAIIPSIPGLQHLDFARDRFAHDKKLIGQYAKLSDAVLADSRSRNSTIEFSLRSSYTYICRRDTLLKYLSENEISELLSQGNLREHLLSNDEHIVVPQLPELLASSLATCISRKLLDDLKLDVNVATDNLVAQCGVLPFGEVIGSKALINAANNSNGLPLQIIMRLLETPPREEIVSPGAKMAMLSDKSWIHIEVTEDSAILTAPNVKQIKCDIDSKDPITMLTDITPWLMLSHLATIPIAVLREGQIEQGAWLDPEILIEVGSCRYVLRKPVSGKLDGLVEHYISGQGSMVCHNEGIVEPITLALMLALMRDRERGDYIVVEARKRNSFALLARINIALRQMQNLADKSAADWAKKILETEIGPALENTLLAH